MQDRRSISTITKKNSCGKVESFHTPVVVENKPGLEELGQDVVGNENI
jgi:hypothetical protein